jgi:purine-nucleoside phosphorylase
MQNKIRQTVAAIEKRHPARPRLGLILGSGLGAYADILQCKTVIPFDELPNFPNPTVAGHSGNLVLGEAEGVPTAVLQGRVHFYEGYTMAEVTFPVRVLGGLGIRQLIVINAAGGIRMDFRPGDLMLIADHINLMGANPLIGANADELGPRFPDMSEAYDGAMRQIAACVACDQGIHLRSGIYAGLAGPSYETPAENVHRPRGDSRQPHGYQGSGNFLHRQYGCRNSAQETDPPGGDGYNPQSQGASYFAFMRHHPDASGRN